MLEVMIGVIVVAAVAVVAFCMVKRKVRRMALDDGEHPDTAVFAAVALATPAAVVAACATAWTWQWVL